jgi:hypothetical protein
VGRLAFSFGKAAIDSASYKETNLIALGVLTRSDETARRMLKWGVNFAAVTPFETKEVLNWQKQLFVGGFKEPEVPVILKAVGDVGALKDFDRGVIQRLIEGLSKVKAEGKLTGETMERFASVGVPAGKVYERLAQIYGTTVPGIMKLREKGAIGSDAGVRAILDVIREDLSGGKLGLLMDKFSETIPGLLSTLWSRPFEFMMDLDESAGFKSFKQALKNLLAAIDQNAGSIKARIADAFNNLAGGLFGELGGANGLAKAEELVMRLLDGVDRLLVIGKEAVAFLTGFGAGFLEGSLGSLKDLFQGPLTEKLAKMTEAGKEFGKAMSGVVDALVKITNFFGDDRWGRVASRMLGHSVETRKSPLKAALGMGLVYGAEDAWNIAAALGGGILGKSPNQESTNGIRAGTGILAQVNPLGPAGAGVRIQAPVNINVDARGATPEAVPLIADRTKEASQQGLASGLEVVACHQ